MRTKNELRKYIRSLQISVKTGDCTYQSVFSTEQIGIVDKTGQFTSYGIAEPNRLFRYVAASLAGGFTEIRPVHERLAALHKIRELRLTMTNPNEEYV